MGLPYIHICLLCDRELSVTKYKIAKNKGISRLISLSKEIGDDIQYKLKDLSKIAVHSSCYQCYIYSSKRIISKQKRVLESEPNSQNAENPQKKPKLRSIDNNHNTLSSEDIEIIQSYSTFQEVNNNSACKDDFLKHYREYEMQRRRCQTLEDAAWYIKNDIDAMFSKNLSNSNDINFYDNQNDLPEALDVLLRNIFEGSNHFRNLEVNYIPVAQIFLFTYLLTLTMLRASTE